MNNIRNQISNFSDSHISALQNASRILVNSNRAISFYQKINFGTTLILAIVGGGVLGSALAILGFIRDSIQKEELNAEITQMLRDLEQDAANYDQTTIDVLHKNGLQIVSSTNGNFTTAGLYDVSINNDETFISFEISGNPLVATIIKVHGGGNGHSVGDVISIDKSEIGGTTGTLDINVTSLITELEAIENFVEEKVNQAINIENRQRRRQNIPTSSSFSTDGFNIVNTQITEPDFNETTNEPTISLKIDTSQFNYDATGNLQLTNHANIGNTANLGIPSDPSAVPPVLATQLNLAVETNTGNIAINTGNISTNTSDISTLQTSLGIASDPLANPPITASGLYAIVEQNVADISAVTGGININQLQQDVIQNTTDLTALETLVGTIPIYDSDGNPIIISTGVFERLDNVYKIIMPEGFTYDNNDNYKLNLGYFEPWDDYKYDLICCALKGSRTGAFDSSFYGGDYLGFMPSLTRMNDVPNIAPVKDIGLQFTNDMFFKRGLVFIELSDPLMDYDLNRKVEFICFVKPT